MIPKSAGDSRRSTSWLPGVRQWRGGRQHGSQKLTDPATDAVTLALQLNKLDDVPRWVPSRG